jgi:ketopantoate reductase
MAHYAFITNGIVTEVITGIDETELIEGKSPEEWYGEFRGQKCLRTSYSSSIRFHFAGIGFSYNEELDAFISPKCHAEAVLNESTCLWTCQNEDHNVIS